MDGPGHRLDVESVGIAAIDQIARPQQPAALSDDRWADYLFMRSNPKGVHFERWQHVHGCGRWFNVARDTVSVRILEVYAMGEPRPPIETPAAPARSAARRDLTVVGSGTDDPP